MLNQSGIQAIGSRNSIHKKHFTLKPNQKIDENGFISFVFVRHPLDRIISAFVDKVLRGSWMKYKNEDGKYQSVTFLQFCQRIIQVAKTKGANKLNGHFRPQYLQCPFCEANFDVIGKLETFGEDKKNLFSALKYEVIK